MMNIYNVVDEEKRERKKERKKDISKKENK